MHGSMGGRWKRSSYGNRTRRPRPTTATAPALDPPRPPANYGRSMGEVDVTVVVLNWHGEAATSRCVVSVQAMRGANRCEVVVVDNESTAASRAALAPLGVRVVQLARNQGFAGGMNAGLAAASTKYVALLNNDLTVDPGWLEAGLAVLDDPTVVMVGGPSLTNGAAQATVHVDPTRYFTVLGDAPPSRRLAPALDGSNLLARRQALAAVGGFDDRYFAYYEDSDLSLRLTDSGDLVFVPEMRVAHERGMSSDRMRARRAYLAGRNQCFNIVKHAPDGLWVKMLTVVIAEHVLRAVRGRRGGLRAEAGHERMARDQRLGLLWAATWLAAHPVTLHRMRGEASHRRDNGWAERLARLNAGMLDDRPSGGNPGPEEVFVERDS
jgi:GT2 family glycosyltransferase